MNFKEKAEEAEKKLIRKSIAMKLFDGINQLKNRSSSKRRWIWELLQNAKDVANGQVKVEIWLTEDYVEFKHNGNPFSVENVTHLIKQVSSKERTTEVNETSKTTGKFGTGFMTTHLLSQKVEVSGILQNEEENAFIYKRFKLLLDRSAKNLDEMIQKVDAAFSIFNEIDNDNFYPKQENYQPNQNCDTSFRYVLDHAGFQVAQTGIQDLQKAIAYALAFIPTIESVTVTDDTQESTYSYKIVNRHQIGKISIVKIERNSTGFSGDVQTIACLSDENQEITIAVEVQTLEEELYSIKEMPKEVPILFCEFPLIGTESFPYPVVINSPLFNPTEPRDGIFLSPENEEETTSNKKLLEKATSLYGDLLNQVTSDWQNVHLLGKLKSAAKLPENVDTDWYKENISDQLVKKLTAAQVVDTVSGQRICLKDSLLPSNKSKDNVKRFAELASSIYANRLPKIEHILDWHDILQSDFGKKFSSEIKYSLNHLLGDIEKQKTLEQLVAIRQYKTDLEDLDWINQVISFTSESNEDLLDKYNVIPNQHNQFKVRKELEKDQAIPEPLKDVLKVLDSDWRETLAHKEITYQFAKVLDINKAVDEINKLIRNKAHPSLRKAVYTIISRFPANATFEEDTKLVSKRNTLWKLARDLDNTVPNKRDLEDWTKDVWQEADLWLLETLVDDIEKLENVQTLSNKLKVTPEKAISWLNNFFAFLKQENQSKLYSKRVIFPNQKGIFREEEALYIDDQIPNELKKVLEDLGRGCRDKLLDVGIQDFNNNRSSFTVKDVSEEIKKRLQEAKKDKDNLAEYWSFSRPIYNLISYFQDSEPNDSKKLKIWEFADRFYSGSIPSKKDLPNLQEFSWDSCNEWILESIAKDIALTKNLEKFSENFNSDQNTAIEWLDNFSFFVAKQDERILNSYAILPNQMGLFKFKKALKKDDGIPEELKEILDVLTSEYWNDFLLNKNFKQMETLFKKEETKTIENIAIEIDKSIKEWERTSRTGEEKFTEVITKMIEWSNKEKDEYIRELFSYFADNKAQLFLKTLGSNEINNGIFTILNHREKLSILTNLAGNSEISEQDLQYFAQNLAQFKEFKEWREQSSEQEFQASTELAEETSLQESSNSVDIGYIGRKGEEFVYQKLVEKFGEERVKWLNKDGESYSAYDFIVIGNNGEEYLYIDAKTTISQESEAGRYPFFVGSSEWDFSATNDRYYLARVFMIQTATPTVKFLQFVRLLDD